MEHCTSAGSLIPVSMAVRLGLPRTLTNVHESLQTQLRKTAPLLGTVWTELWKCTAHEHNAFTQKVGCLEGVGHTGHKPLLARLQSAVAASRKW